MAPPPGSRAPRPAPGPGTLLAGRYRLADARPPAEGDAGQAARWRAVDEVLARPVDVLLLPVDGERAAAGRALLDAASAAGAVLSPVPAQVYDAALETLCTEHGDVEVAYVVTEAVRDRRLAEVLTEDGPLEPAQARRLVERAAEGLRAAHARGVAHGSLHPGTLAVADDGARLLDTAVGAALARDGRAAPPDPAEDVTALVGCLYAALTARWPERDVPGPSGGLRAAPLSGGRSCAPRQVRAGVPRSLDAVVVQGLGDDRFRTADELLDALHRAGDLDAPAAPARRPAARRLPPLPPPRRRRLPVTLGLLLAVAVLAGLGALAIAQLVGPSSPSATAEATDQPTDQAQPTDSAQGTAAPSAPAPPAAAATPLDLSSASVTAFDPPPGDGAESSGQVQRAVDGDPDTAWETERYDSAALGGLKDGVGLLVDLGEAVPVQRVEAALTAGTDVELRAGDVAPTGSADDLPVVATGTADADASPVALVPTTPVTARYLLLWITGLPPEQGGFRAAVRELAVLRG